MTDADRTAVLICQSIRITSVNKRASGYGQLLRDVYSKPMNSYGVMAKWFPKYACLWYIHICTIARVSLTIPAEAACLLCVNTGCRGDYPACNYLYHRQYLLKFIVHECRRIIRRASCAPGAVGARYFFRIMNANFIYRATKWQQTGNSGSEEAGLCWNRLINFGGNTWFGQRLHRTWFGDRLISISEDHYKGSGDQFLFVFLHTYGWIYYYYVRMGLFPGRDDDGLPCHLFAHVANCVRLYMYLETPWLYALPVNVSDRFAYQLSIFRSTLPLGRTVSRVKYYEDYCVFSLVSMH